MKAGKNSPEELLPKDSYFRRKKTTLDVYGDVIASLAARDRDFLDLGCGKKSEVTLIEGKVRSLTGMDALYSAIKENETPMRRTVGDSTALPFKDGSFDVIVSQWMMEHIADPAGVLKECHRVLRKGGNVVMVTNSKYHPMMFMSSILPRGFRDWLKKIILPSFIEEDTFDTFYVFNSLADTDAAMTAAGFTRKFASYTGAPFFMYSRLLFKLSEWYERLTDMPGLAAGKMHVIVHYEKKAD